VTTNGTTLDVRTALTRLDRKWTRDTAADPLDDDRLTHYAEGLGDLARATDDTRDLGHIRAQLTAMTAERDQLTTENRTVRADLSETRAARDTARGELADAQHALRQRDEAHARRVEELETTLAAIVHQTPAAEPVTAPAAPVDGEHRHRYPLDDLGIPDACECGALHPRLVLAYEIAHAEPEPADPQAWPERLGDLFPTEPGTRRKPRGVCRGCSVDHPVKVDGTVAVHPHGDRRCDGSNQPPLHPAVVLSAPDNASTVSATDATLQVIPDA
jgi:regulator of replication initiation timing